MWSDLEGEDWKFVCMRRPTEKELGGSIRVNLPSNFPITLCSKINITWWTHAQFAYNSED